MNEKTHPLTVVMGGKKISDKTLVIDNLIKKCDYLLVGGGMCFTALEENIFGQTWFECERHPALEEEMIVTHWMPLPEPPEKESES